MPAQGEPVSTRLLYIQLYTFVYSEIHSRPARHHPQRPCGSCFPRPLPGCGLWRCTTVGLFLAALLLSPLKWLFFRLQEGESISGKASE